MNETWTVECYGDRAEYTSIMDVLAAVTDYLKDGATDIRITRKV